jgi:kynurenine formamidase
MNFNDLNFIDLTHPLSPDIAQWDIGCGFQHNNHIDYSDSKTEIKFRAQQLTMSAGIGTHMDAPAHCFPKGACIADIPLSQLIAPCVVINVAAQAHEKYQVTTDDINQFETEFGKITQNTFVIICTGWEQLWSQPEKYRNNLIFPCISKQAAEILMDRNVCGIGIDTLSPDCAGSGFPVHQLFLGAGKYIVENIAHAHQLPAKGAYSFVLPIKIKEGTEAPVRLIAMY